MNNFGKILKELYKASKKSGAWRTFVFCLAAIVVFTTTYSLILPAITVEKSAAEDVGGLVMEEENPGSTGAGTEASGEVVTVDAENASSEAAESSAEQEDRTGEEPASASVSEPSGQVQAVYDEAEKEDAAEYREPVNGEVQTIGDRRVMIFTGDDFDVVVSGDLSVGVSDGTVLSVRGIPYPDVVRSYSDRISDELLNIFVDTKTTEVLYQLVFTDEDLVEYTPAGYFDVQFIFHNNTVSHTGEMIYAAIYDYLTDEMILAEKNGDAYETPVISLNEYGVITGVTLKHLSFGEYTDIITLVAGPVNEELKLAAEKAADSTVTDSKTESGSESAESGSKTESGSKSAESGSKTESSSKSAESGSKTESGSESAKSGSKTESSTESAESKTAETESTGAKTDSGESRSEGPSAKAETSKKSEETGSGTLTVRGSDYSVTLAYGADAKIPAGAVLEVTEIENGTSAYKKYLAQAKAAMGLDQDQVLPKEQARFFDIRIMADGKEVQPAANVNVNITYDRPVVETDPGTEAQIDASAVHFGKEGAEVVEVSDADVNRVEFEAESFSIYGVIYTVDFEYTDPTTGGTYYYSLNGGESIHLTDLLVILGIKDEDEAAKFVAEEVENVEFSDPELVEVTHKGKILGIFGTEDWLLLSRKPFDTEETLTISLRNGEKIAVKVTDDQTDGVWDLADTDNTRSLHVSADVSVTTTPQERDAAFRLTFTYSLTEDVVHAIDDYDKPFTLEYDLSSVIADTPLEIRNNTNGVISIGSRRLGTYKVIDGKVTLNFTDIAYFDGKSEFTGYFRLTVQTNESELGDDDKYTYTFPGTSDTVPIKYKEKVENGAKSVEVEPDADGSYTLHYTANVDVISDLDELTFYDTIGGLQTLDPSSVKIGDRSVSVTQTENGFTFDVASALGTTGVAKGSYQVTYDTKLTAEQLQEMTSDKTTETNKVSWKVNGSKDVTGGETSEEFKKPKEPIPVVKTISSTANQPGDIVNYTITFGKDTTELSGFHISDVMTDVVIPQGKVTLTYNGQSQEIDFGPQSTDSSYSKGSVTLFDYTFPEGTAGNGPVTATYSVQLIDADTAQVNGVYDKTEVSNIATEHRQNTNDTEKTTVTYDKEPEYTVTKSQTSNKTEDGKWAPGTEIHYTLTIGDADTNMAGVNIKDLMTDLQVLQGDVMIKVGNGSTMRLTDYDTDAMKWFDDRHYSPYDVELFNFNMPSDAGNGPVVITYTTKVISQDQAASAGIYGDQAIRNTGTGGKESDGTTGIGEFREFPITKDVTQNGASVNGQTVGMGSIVHYTLTYGEEGMDLANVVIEDYMTDLQKLAGEITIKKSDGTTFTMPQGTGQYSENGNNWIFWDDGRYNTDSSGNRICLFKYRLPNDIGEGPITVEYDVQIISEAEAKESGINDTQSAFNKFIKPETEVKIEFPKEVTHNPQVRKEFDKWDVDTGKVYWNIIIEKDAESAYPLENVWVRESTDNNNVHFSSENQQLWDYIAKAGEFDVINAVVTTDDGTILTPGVDYTVDTANAQFNFPVLNERVHINLAFQAPVKIIDGTWMKNEVRINDDKTAEAEATYNSPKINMIKNGAYTESDRLIKWEVMLNPSKKEFQDSDPIRVWFEDKIPEGLVLVNYQTKQEQNPSIYVHYEGELWWNHEYPVSVNSETNTIEKTDIAAHNPNYSDEHYGLNREKMVITYYTLLSDEEWDEITSSASGSASLKNHVDVTAGDNEHFEATDTVTVTSEGYLNKTDTTEEPGGIVIDPETGENSKNITYRVEINPNGYLLNKGQALSLTDYIDTNMDLDPSSVVLKNAHKVGDELVADGDAEGIVISYNDDSRLLHLQNIPDSTPLLLTYTCIARAQGTDTFTNTATLIGGGSHSSTDTKEHKIQVNDAGVTVEGINVSLLKIDENDVKKTLEGAQFQLYECTLAIGDLTEKPQQYWDDLLAKMNRIIAGGGTEEEIAAIRAEFQITDWVEVGSPQTSRENGRIPGWERLSEHKLYAWREVTSPENYTGSSEYHYFVGYQYLDVNTENPGETTMLPEQEQTDRKHAAWALDDAVQLANGIRAASIANLTSWTATNVESVYTSISATKTWEGDSDNRFRTRPVGGIRLQLVRINADGSRENVGDPVAINADNNGNWPTYIWNRLPSQDEDGNELKYTVVEERVDDYTTEYSDGGDGIAAGEITVTNKMIPKNTNIYVEKAFDQEGDEKPESIHITLMIIKTDLEGNVSEPEEYMECKLNEYNEWKHVFDKLPTKEVDEEGNAYYLTYTAVEDLAALERQGFRYTVSYSDNGQGVLETTEEEPLLITNTAPRNGSLKIKKRVTVNGSDPTAETYSLVNGTYTFTVMKKGDAEFVPRTVELTINGNNIAESDEITDLPAGTYVITEASQTGTELIEATVDNIPATITSRSVEVVVTAGKVAGEAPVVSFTNNATKIDFEKIWKYNNASMKWADNTSITVTVSGGNRRYIYTISRNDLIAGKEISGQTEGDPKLTVRTVHEDDQTETYEYKFEVRELPYNNGDPYIVTEHKVDKYKDPIYKAGEVDTPYGAKDGGAIINTAEESYELPESGGVGTTLFYLFGTVLLTCAGVLLVMRRKKAV